MTKIPYQCDEQTWEKICRGYSALRTWEHGYANLSDFIGKVVLHVFHDSVGISGNNEAVVFIFEDGTGFEMCHEQDCCETVQVEDICGNLEDLVGTPLLKAEQRSNGGMTEDGSITWTFYEFATIKGSVTIRWYGESNGWYSEAVDLVKLVKREPA